MQRLTQVSSQFVGTVKASIIGIRAQDMVGFIWYSVYPEGEQAYCMPMPKKLHVVFGAKNVGSEDGELFGRLLSNGRVLIEGRKQWCAVGEYVYWESDLDMPFEGLNLTVDVGHNTAVDQTYSFRIETSVEIPYDYIWEWAGHTNKATFEWIEEPVGTFKSGTKPPSDDELIEKAKAAYYGVIVGEFIRKCAEQGITASLVDILPSAWVNKSEVRRIIWPPGFVASCSQDVTVYVAGKVYFNSDQDLVGSPVSSLFVMVVSACIAMIIVATLTGIGLLEYFRDMGTTKSEVSETSRITFPADTHVDADWTLPDGSVIPACQTLPAGTVIEWTKTETTETKDWMTLLILGMIGLGAIVTVAVLVPALRGK